MRGLTLQLLTVLCCLLLQRSLGITFTPRAASSRALNHSHSAHRPRQLTLPISAHHTVVTPNSQRAGSNHTFHPLQLAVSNLTGCAAIDFSASISIDGQGPFRLILDSGSTTLAVVSASCTNCEGATPVYTPTASASANDGAAVSSAYGGNTSWSGHSWRANVSLGGSAAVSLVIASIDSSDGFISRQDVCAINPQHTGLNASQGIMGFAFPSLAAAGTDSWIAAYVAASGVSNEFTLQMCPTGGNVWIGGYDPSFLSAPFTYIPIVKENYYNVLLTQMAVLPSRLGASAAPLPFNQSTYGPCSSSPYVADCTIVDSGTSEILLPAAAFEALITALRNDEYYQQYFSQADILSRAAARWPLTSVRDWGRCRRSCRSCPSPSATAPPSASTPSRAGCRWPTTSPATPTTAGRWAGWRADTRCWAPPSARSSLSGTTWLTARSASATPRGAETRPHHCSRTAGRRAHGAAAA